MTSNKPAYDDSFSLDNLSDYLSQLILQAYESDLDKFEAVDLRIAFYTFMDSCSRLKEQLFLFAVVSNQYDKLMKVMDEYEKTATGLSMEKLQEVRSEWAQLYKQFSLQNPTEENINNLPYRYARMSQAAKSWRFRQELHLWQEQYGFRRPISSMNDEDKQKQKKRTGRKVVYSFLNETKNKKISQ